MHGPMNIKSIYFLYMCNLADFNMYKIFLPTEYKFSALNNFLCLFVATIYDLLVRPNIKYSHHIYSNNCIMIKYNDVV